MKNQCQGCQAGWPIVKVEMFGLTMHEVPGYAGEKVVCRKEDYEDNNNDRD